MDKPVRMRMRHGAMGLTPHQQDGQREQEQEKMKKSQQQSKWVKVNSLMYNTIVLVRLVQNEKTTSVR